MRRLRRKLLGVLIVAVLLISLGTSIWKVYQQVQQTHLSCALITAIKKNDTAAGIALLAKGAAPNSKDLPPDTRSV